MEEFELFDRVWHPRLGWGIIQKIDTLDNPYPIEVFFEDTGGFCTFTTDGKALEMDKSPSLFFNIPEMYKTKDFPKKSRQPNGRESLIKMVEAVIPLPDEIKESSVEKIREYYFSIHRHYENLFKK